MGVIVALTASSGVSALWRDVLVLGTSKIEIAYPDPPYYTADWQGDWQGELAPGKVAARKIRVLYTGWAPTAGAISVAATLGHSNSAFSGAFDMAQINRDDCSASPGEGVAGDVILTRGVATTLCVRYKLRTTAPSSLQGQDLAPFVTVNIKAASSVTPSWSDVAKTLTSPLPAMTVPPPSAPVSCATTGGVLLSADGYVTLTWPESSGVDSYRVTLHNEANTASQVITTIPAQGQRSVKLTTSIALIPDLLTLLSLSKPPKMLLSVETVKDGWLSTTRLSQPVKRVGLNLTLGLGGWQCDA